MWYVEERSARKLRAAAAGSDPATRALTRVSSGVRDRLTAGSPAPRAAADAPGAAGAACTTAAAGRTRVTEASSAAPENARRFMCAVWGHDARDMCDFANVAE